MKEKRTSIRMRILRLYLISVGVVIFSLSGMLAMQLDYVGTSAYKREIESMAVAYADTLSMESTANLSSDHLGEGGFINVISPDDVIIASSNKENVGTSVGEYGKISEGLHELGNDLICYCKAVPNTDGVVVIVVGNMSDSHRAVGKCLAISMTLGVLLCIAAVIVSLKISKRIVHPIIATTERLELLAKGDISSSVEVFNRRDETENLSKALDKTCTELQRYISYITSTTSEMANGDFSHKNAIECLGDFENIPIAFKKIHDVLKETIQNLIDSSNNVHTGSEQISSGAQMLAEGTTKQATAVDELSATVASISEGVDVTAKGANEANQLSSDCASKMREQDAAMQKMLEAMKTIEEKSEAISNVIKAIEDIAFQTNILALNASIEAARAGETGKGFAVVASEVGNLAQKSAQSANSTKELITSTLEAVKIGSKIADDTANALKEVTSLSEKSAELVQKITEDANKQAVALTQATKGIEDISQVIQMNSATAEQSAASCEELSAQAKLLSEQVSKLKA